TTLTTTGYGDISVKDSSVWMKIYACLLMIVGSAAVATLYSLITDFIVTSRFNEMMGRSAVRSHEHVIVVGLGTVGYRTAIALSEMGAEVAVADLQTDPGLRKLLPPEIAFISGDGRDSDTLELAGISTAQAVVSMTGDDAQNLSIGLTAGSLNPGCRVVVRLFDADLAEKIETSMGISRAMSASRISAPTFVSAALCDDAVYSYVSGDHFVIVREGPEGHLRSEIRSLKPSPRRR
ncbi:MAG TPA: NAD-binding protein, partial [Fimbriimonadaceae bacterium]|nr:NAD-binding protein [Fimbriimonadaceae bacterium]